MVIRRLISEWTARLLLIVMIVGLFAAIMIGRSPAQAIEIHAVMPEKGGWLPDDLSAVVGVPLHMRLTSGDVMHGFAVGQQSWPAVDVKPGQVTELSLTFDEPGTYTYYCTRWCGPNHWRMRGTIEVIDGANGETVTESPAAEPAQRPLYISLGLDIDAPHEVNARLDRPPSVGLGEAHRDSVPPRFLAMDVYLEQTPFDIWQSLQLGVDRGSRTDSELWDLVAYIWQSNTSTEELTLGRKLYAENCAACHGERGGGDGVMVSPRLSSGTSEALGLKTSIPTDFSDPEQMLGASTALLQGKIIRGGMGTGMPYWGNVFTDKEVAALIAYLWTFQFPVTEVE